MTDGVDLTILENTAEISENAKTLIGAVCGDRIIVSYINDGKLLLPVLEKSDTGNLLSKRNTFVLRGRDKEMLQQYGKDFIIEQKGNNCVLKGNGETIYTNVQEAVKDIKRKIDLEILTDTNYNIQKFNSYII